MGPLDDNDLLLYAYSDSLVLKLRQQGKSLEEIVRDYASRDVPSMFDLNRLFEHSVAGQRIKEADTDVKVMDFIVDRFRDQRLFFCVNHAANALMIHMVDQVLAKLGFGPLPRYAHEALGELFDPTVPIHSSVARHYNLSWSTPEMRRRIDTRRRLTWEEYIYQFAVHREPAELVPSVTPLRARQRAVDRWLEAVIDRFEDPDFDWRTIHPVGQAFAEAYPGRTFPPAVEKKVLDCARRDVNQRLEQVTATLRDQWPLLRFDYDPSNIHSSLIAVDGIEAALMAMLPGRRQFEHAVAAFQRYLERGRPELPRRIGRLRHAVRRNRSDRSDRTRQAPHRLTTVPELDFNKASVEEILAAFRTNACVLLRDFCNHDKLTALHRDIGMLHDKFDNFHLYVEDIRAEGYPLPHEYIFTEKHRAVLDRCSEISNTVFSAAR